MNNHSVDYVTGASAAEQVPGLVCVLFGQGSDMADAQQSAQLHLPGDRLNRPVHMFGSGFWAGQGAAPEPGGRSTPNLAEQSNSWAPEIVMCAAPAAPPGGAGPKQQLLPVPASLGLRGITCCLPRRGAR